jgi:hypothetical protein
VRALYAHDAVLAMAPDADLAAPGGAVTLALCGAFEHPPPCPVAPHNTQAHRRGDDVVVRVVFAAEPAVEAEVRARIEAALAGGFCHGPDGTRTRWTVLTNAAGVVTPAERARGARLAAS